MEENKNIQSEQQQNQLQTSNALPNMPRLRDKPGIMGFTGFGTTPHQEEDTLTLEYPEFKEQINKALQAGENRDNIRKELAALESVALTQYSYDEVNQFLGRNSDTVPKLIDEMMRQKDNSYIEIMKTDMPEKQVRDILWLAHESGITPGVLLLNPEFAAKIKKDMEGDNPNFLYAGGRNLFSQLQESNVDKYSLAIAEIEQQMENDDILLSEGRRLYEGMLKTKPYLSDDEYRDLARNAFQQQIKNLEEKAKIDAQDAEKWRTQILRPDKYQNWWKYQLYEAIANAGFTGKSMLAGALTYNVGNFIMPGLGAALTPIVDAFMAIDEARSEAAQAYKEYFMRYGDKKKALEVGHNVEAVNRIFLPISNFASSRILEKWDDTLFERWGKKILKGQDFAPTLGRRLTARFVTDYLPGLVNALPEGVEEVVQEITSTVAQEDEIDYNRLKEAFTQGVFSGALLGWGRTSIGNVYDYAKEQRYHQNFSREKKFLQKINPKLFGLFKIGNDISNGRLNVDDVVEQTPVVFVPKSKITEEVAQALNIEDETTENNEEIIDPEKATGVSEAPDAINVTEIAGEDATAIESEIVPEDEEIAIKKEDWEKFAAENPEQAQALQNYVREGTQGITAQEKIEQATREIIEAVNEAPEIKEQAERLEQEFIQAGRPQNEARALAQVAGTIAGAINKQYGISVNQTMNLEAVKGNEQNQANSRQAESHNQPLNSNVDLDTDFEVEPVQLTGEIVNKEDLTKKLRELLNSSGIITKDNLGYISLGSNKKIKHVIHSSRSAKALNSQTQELRGRALSSIQDLIKNSVLVESIANKKNSGNPNVGNYHRFYTPIATTDGNYYAVRIVAEEGKNGTLRPIQATLYDLILEGKKNVSPLPQRHPSNEGSIVDLHNEKLKITLRDLLGNVKDSEGNFYITPDTQNDTEREGYNQTQPSGTRQEQAKFYEDFNNSHERPEYLNTGNVTTNINDYGNGVEIEFLGERANGISRSAQFPSGRKASQQEREGVIKYLLYDAIPELEMRIHDMFGGFPTVELSEKYQGQDLRNLTAEQKAEILSTAENLIQQMMGDPLSEEGRELLAESRYGEMPETNNSALTKEEREIAKSESFKRWLGFDWETGKLTAFDFLQPTEEELNRRANKLAEILDKNGEPKSEVIRDYQIHQVMSELYNKREKELLLKEKELLNKYVLRTEEAEKEDKEVGILTVKNGKTEQKFKVIRTQKSANSRVGRIDGANLDIRNKKGEVIATYFPYGKATLEFIRSQESKMGPRNQWKRSFINAFNNNLNQYLRAGDFLDANGNLVKDGNEAFRERWDKRTQEAIENNIDSGFYDNKIYPEDFESRELYERVKAEIDAAKAVKYSMDTPFGTVEIDNETGKPVLSDNEQINARTSWPKNTSSAETQSLVEFFTSANASTGFHEIAHHVLRVLTDAAQLENASDILINDVETILKNAGVKKSDFYNDIGTARQDAQEYFAKSFEAYLHKGQAPTKELQSSFDRIKQWLVDVYQNIKESLGFELNEEMQDIFDRLLATPEQLAEQKSISDIETLYAATEGEIQRLQKEINDLEAQLLANSQAWEKTTEKAYVKGEKQGRKTQKEIDKVKFADKITKLKQRQKEMKERQHERQNIKKKVAKLVKNINRMAEAQNVDWFRQQDIKNLLDTYDTAKLRSLNLQDIEYLHNQVKEIYETGKRELAQKRLAKQKYIEQARRELAEPLRKDWENRPKGVATSSAETGKQYKGVKGRIQKILDWTTAKTFGAQRFFDYLDGYKHNKGAFSKYFLDDVNEAYNTKLVHIYARLGAMEIAKARLGIKPKDLAKTREFSAPHRNGKNWTVEELIGIYAGLKNAKSRDAILFGNFSMAESYEQAEAWATEAVSKLTENEKALGDFIIQEYEDNFERINSALVKVWNKGMKHEENYTPIRRLEVTSSNGGMINPDAAAEVLINPNSNGSLGRVERGFSQSRVNFRQKTQPGMNLKIVSVWYSQVEAQEHAAAFGGVVQNLRRILLGKGENSEASIYKMIRETRGKYAAEMIKQYFNIAATNETMQAYNSLDDIAKFLAKNMSIAYLCGNMGTALKQFNSFFFAVPYTSPTAMINNLIKATTNWKKFSEECFRLDPQLKARNGDPFIQELRKGKSVVYDNLLKWGSTPIGFMDRFTSCVVFKSVYDSNLRQGLSQNDAIKEAQRVVLLTQPPAHAKDKPLIWQQHGYARLAMMFTNSLSNIYGITMYELTQEIRHGEVPRVFTTAIGLTLAAMYITALTSGGPDEPDDPEEWAKWTASAFTEQTINSIPLIGKEALALWDYRRGYFKNDSAFIAPFAKLAAGTRGLWDDKSDNDERAIWNLIEGGSLLAPFPSTALHRLYNIGKELGEGEIGAALKRMVGINKEEKKIKKAVSY